MSATRFRLLIMALVTGWALLGGPVAAQETPPPAAAPADSTGERRISPRGAFLRSLVLPGWGQSVLGSPGRGAVYFALESGSLWMVYKSREKLGAARREQELLREAGEIEVDATTGLVRSREQQVEDWVTLSVFWLLFSGADAYVGAYLQGFDENVGVAATPDGALQLGVTVPTGRPR